MAERVLGLGGFFFKGRDPRALADWYRDALGLPVQDFGGMFCANWDFGEREPGSTVWTVFPEASTHFPGRAMVNFRVADLLAMLAQLRAFGAVVEGDGDASEFGRFAWTTDPEGNRIELWEPPPLAK